MSRLKSRTQGLPYKFQFFQPQTGFKTANDCFDVVVNQVIANRKGNAFIAQQNNLSTDRKIVELEVEDFNAKRMLAHKGWEHFAYPDTGGPDLKAWSLSATPLRRLSAGVAGVAGAVRRTASGVALITQWLGQSLRPVDHELAEKRALTCLNCQHNSDPTWFSKLTGAIAGEVKALLEVKNDLRLSTSVDSKLHFCDICLCALSLKCHSPIELILKNSEASVLKKHSEVEIIGGKRCWVTEEGEKLK